MVLVDELQMEMAADLEMAVDLQKLRNMDQEQQDISWSVIRNQILDVENLIFSNS